MACLQESGSVAMKRAKVKVFIQDRFNPVLFTEDAERYVDVSNIVCALTRYNYREDTLELEEDDLILLLDVFHDTNEVVTVTEAAESAGVEMTVPRGLGVLPCMGYIGMCGPKGYRFSAVLVLNRVSILTDFGHFGHK